MVLIFGRVLKWCLGGGGGGGGGGAGGFDKSQLGNQMCENDTGGGTQPSVLIKVVFIKKCVITL